MEITHIQRVKTLVQKPQRGIESEQAVSGGMLSCHSSQDQLF